VEDPDLSGSNDGVTKFDCSDGDQVRELVRVKLQIASLHNQVDSLNRVVDSMNVVVESLSKLVIPNEGSNLHSELRLETMLTEFSNILENKNKVIYDLENTIIELEHKLAEVSKDRDELKNDAQLLFNRRTATKDLS
jgi:predicted RNase H-like nuclease (RuvC/YqgF family)